MGADLECIFKKKQVSITAETMGSHLIVAKLWVLFGLFLLVPRLGQNPAPQICFATEPHSQPQIASLVSVLKSSVSLQGNLNKIVGHMN